MAKRDRTALAAAALVLVACGPRGAAPDPPRAPASPAVAPSAAGAEETGATPATETATSSPTDEATTASPAPVETAPPGDDRLTVEAAYPAGAYPWSRDPAARRARIADLERWNAGGVAEGERWHAAPRVVIGEPVLVGGKMSARDAMRVLRREQYWTVRRCYEPRLREHPALEGRAVLRLGIGGDGTVREAALDKGRVPDDRKHGHAMTDREVLACLLHSFRGVRLPAPRSRSAALRVAIDVWPGDARLPEPAGAPGRGTIALAKVDEAIAGARPALTGCFERAQRGAWGRLALRLDVDGEGRVDDVTEVESTFPDADVTACAAAVLRGLRLPAPDGGEARTIAALRWSAR